MDTIIETNERELAEALLDTFIEKGYWLETCSDLKNYGQKVDSRSYLRRVIDCIRTEISLTATIPSIINVLAENGHAEGFSLEEDYYGPAEATLYQEFHDDLLKNLEPLFTQLVDEYNLDDVVCQEVDL